jgi:putative ABC transport system ATP-binding protein
MSPDTQSSTIVVSGLSQAYRDGQHVHRVLAGVDMQIEPGECVALLGRSGSGKSTLLNLVGGIDRPDEGTIHVRGLCISQLPEPDRTVLRREQIGFIYQFFNLVPTLTALENVSLPLELIHPGAADNEHKAITQLAAVGLSGRRDSYPDQLSGGEQQRIAIARSLVHRPALVLADEPTGNLDQQAGESVLDMMFCLLREEGSSLLMVTHSLSVARRADRILTLQDGELAQGGSDLAW